MSEMEESRGNEVPKKLEEERGVPPVNARKRGGKLGKYLGIVALLMIVGVMIWLNVKPKAAPAVREASISQTRRGLPALGLGEEPPPPPPVAVTPATAPPAPGPAPAPAAGPTKPAGPTEEELLMQRRQRAPIIAFGGGASGAAGGTPASVGAAADEGGEGELNVALRATKTEAVSASMLPNRNYLIAKGTFLDCALITAIESTLPGMTSCRLTRNIYSDNGKVLLLERGSLIEGEYKSGQMRQGMNRIFVLWTRARTPNGVVVRLDSPGADELGRSGMPGWVNTHFWKRYGGALMLSIVDDAAEFLVQQQRSNSGGDSISFEGTGDATSQAAAIALQNTINIPPTLNKNQGDLINIYVARDLDFRGVYELRGQ